MAQKQSILGRISQLTRANINALLDRAEDPEKMLDQLVRDYTNSIADAEEAVAQTIAQVRMAEADLKEDQDAAQEWGRKAAAASAKATSPTRRVLPSSAAGTRLMAPTGSPSISRMRLSPSFTAGRKACATTSLAALRMAPAVPPARSAP